MMFKSIRKDLKVVLLCAGLVGTMLGASYAAVPLYDLFCRVTGFGGTTQRAEAPSQEVLDQLISVRFDANVSADLDWDFRPEQREVKLRVGENGLMLYSAANLGDAASIGTASFNVTPTIAGQYFVKVTCFCFEEQELAAGEQIDMPVAYYVDPAIMDDPDLQTLPEITLSYTFFPVEKDDDVARAGQDEINGDAAGGASSIAAFAAGSSAESMGDSR